MKTEMLTILLILMNSMTAKANSEAQIRVSDISPEIQQCLILAAAPEDRRLLRLGLDNDCYEQLTEADKRKILHILYKINDKNFTGIPLISK